MQQTRSINLTDVLKHELAPIPTSMFKDDGEMRIASTKSDLKKKLQVGISSRIVDKVDATIIDGCALLWSVHWPEKGTVKNYVDNFCEYMQGPSITLSGPGTCVNTGPLPHPWVGFTITSISVITHLKPPITGINCVLGIYEIQLLYKHLLQ